ncbi:sugar ABC transporter substrate-binding protein [Nibricoccus sp. IMCC34717]|uniref:sugar ABC transporter substrate-binding protein n=1 Tax=Nibricoccus sp. IMCC34717 TaxID=3034021 RepID=UPI00384F3B84
MITRLLTLFCALFLVAGCGKKEGSNAGSSSGAAQPAEKQLVVGVAFETLQTEYWVAGFEAIRQELAKRNIRMLEAVADGDANRQLQQVKTFIARGVDGLILVPKDAKTCVPMVKAANAAKIPVVLFNRPADLGDAVATAVVADNRALTRETVAFMVEQARKAGGKHQAMIVLGDLGDPNAIGRRDGFQDVIANHGDLIDVVARVPSEWNQEKAQAGVANALRANPDIRFIFTSSDFLLPSLVSALKAAGRYHKIGEPGHVILGGFDGDATAYQMLKDGYLDATGVQDVYFEASASVQALIDQRSGKPAQPLLLDPGFVIHQGNLKEMAPRMWGAQVKR